MVNASFAGSPSRKGEMMGNKATLEALYYTAPLGDRITTLELRQPNKLVLYTEDTKVLDRFRHWSQLLYLIPYTQDQGEKHPVEVLIAADLYFPLRSRGELVRALRRGK